MSSARRYTGSSLPHEDQEARIQLMEWRIRAGLNPSDGEPMPEDVREQMVRWVMTHDDSKSRLRR